MSRYRALSVEVGTALMVLNLAAWGAWAAAREPRSASACALLQAKRAERDQAAAARTGFPRAYTDSEHLLFRRPLGPLASEPAAVRALAVANALPLVVAWSFVVPAQSSEIGPTCSESHTCGVLFLVLCAAQWALLGGAVGHALSRRRV